MYIYIYIYSTGKNGCRKLTLMGLRHNSVIQGPNFVYMLYLWYDLSEIVGGFGPSYLCGYELGKPENVDFDAKTGKNEVNRAPPDRGVMPRVQVMGCIKYEH